MHPDRQARIQPAPAQSEVKKTRHGRANLKGSRKLIIKGKLKPVKEIKFDDDARRDYLTGFSKRKNERREYARQKAQLREREERNELRAHLRQSRQEQAEANVRAARQAYGEIDADTEEADGDALEPARYMTDEMTTTVSIEPFDVTEQDEEPKRQRQPKKVSIAVPGPSQKAYVPKKPTPKRKDRLKRPRQSSAQKKQRK
ncbi:uncharacterized protein L969DRAFT_92551 [Mixia osmundae IAM 14324]|uniref:Ribosomal RNA-processing protein 17 n=1 Tax=Mixia osmundae (strain CBS 9802 / IAM 14324 / JCM 22182 / KY 12970) TaxID=764103 RepID=G7DXV8_MIXOS|nr:uncharacterized protein L969DRAFT_92551 [Mixia osmundae IAM 14324]KEI41321.1 hypothetical protein L969DRAFT_92551 [Mixia osmundae IAM 14324]GAA95418.1 hypothetical protein E5Q_02072 [Mixia osmundae IAM 14324]